jgi:hypothetical protein
VEPMGLEVASLQKPTHGLLKFSWAVPYEAVMHGARVFGNLVKTRPDREVMASIWDIDVIVREGIVRENCSWGSMLCGWRTPLAVMVVSGMVGLDRGPMKRGGVAPLLVGATSSLMIIKQQRRRDCGRKIAELQRSDWTV